MLKFYSNIKDIPDSVEIVHDVEAYFIKYMYTETEFEKFILKSIEKSEFINSSSVIDRFGYKLWINNISTGCKAALLCFAFPDKVIDLIECGDNVRDFIVNFIKQGNVLLSDREAVFRELESKVDIVANGFRISTISELNECIYEGCYYEGDVYVQN